MSDARSPRRAPLWLIGSILINVLLLGAIGGFVVRGGLSTDRPHFERTHDATRFVRDDATRADRAAVWRVLRESFEASADARDARDTARIALAKALEADPYDADAVNAAFDEMRKAEMNMQAAVHEALALRLADLTPRQRAGVRAALERGPRRRRSERRKHERHNDRTKD